MALTVQTRSEDHRHHPVLAVKRHVGNVGSLTAEYTAINIHSPVEWGNCPIISLPVRVIGADFAAHGRPSVHGRDLDSASTTRCGAV